MNVIAPGRGPALMRLSQHRRRPPLKVLLIARELTGVWVVDVSDPTAPTGVSTFDTWGSASAVTAGNNHVYVADASGGLLILN